MSHDVHACQDLNVSSASAEYPPLNLVIFGSRIRRNSFDAWAAGTAETSAAMAAASWGPPIKVGIQLTSKVWFIGLAPRCGVDEHGVVGGVFCWSSESASSDFRSGICNLSPNQTCFLEGKGLILWLINGLCTPSCVDCAWEIIEYLLSQVCLFLGRSYWRQGCVACQRQL